jgi:beta-lactamase regulating signal transducer with metallopeptidase domain
MNTFIARLGVVPADSAPLVAILTKLTLVLAVAWLFHAALGRSNPRWRVLVWRLSASAIVLLGGLALAPPFLHLAILPSATPTALPATESAAKTESATKTPATGTGAQQRSARIAASADPAAQTNLLERRSTLAVDGPAAVKNSVRTALSGGTSSPRVADRPRADAARAIASSAAVSVPSDAIPRPSSERVEKQTNDRANERALAGWLFAIWLAGAAAVALRAVVGLLGLRRIRRTAVPVPDGVRSVAERVAGTLGVVRPFRLCQTQELQTPCVIGLLRPMILLPERQCLPRLGDELPAILAHELAHLKGGDLFWNSLLHVQSLAIWFHPLAWRIRLAHADACDAVCDALATDYVGDAGLYGRILARLTLRISGAKASPGLAMARVCSIERRIAAIRRHVFRAALSRRRSLCAVALSTAAIAALGGLVLAPSQAQTPSVSMPSASAKDTAARQPAANSSSATQAFATRAAVSSAFSAHWRAPNRKTDSRAAAVETVAETTAPNTARSAESAVTVVPSPVGPESWATFRNGNHQLGIAKTTLPETPEVLWQFSTSDGVVACAAIVGDQVYVPCLNGELVSVDRKTGMKQWTYRSIESKNPNDFAPGFKAAPTVTNDTVYIGDEDGIMHAVDRRTGKAQWKFRTGAEIAGRSPSSTIRWFSARTTASSTV